MKEVLKLADRYEVDLPFLIQLNEIYLFAYFYLITNSTSSEGELGKGPL